MPADAPRGAALLQQAALPSGVDGGLLVGDKGKAVPVLKPGGQGHTVVLFACLTRTSEEGDCKLSHAGTSGTPRQARPREPAWPFGPEGVTAGGFALRGVFPARPPVALRPRLFSPAISCSFCAVHSVGSLVYPHSSRKRSRPRLSDEEAEAERGGATPAGKWRRCQSQPAGSLWRRQVPAEVG